MKLAETAIKEFQAMYKARFGTEIDPETAEHEAMQLLRLVNTVQPRNELSMKMDMEINSGIQKPESHIPRRAGHGRLQSQ